MVTGRIEPCINRSIDEFLGLITIDQCLTLNTVDECLTVFHFVFICFSC